MKLLSLLLLLPSLSWSFECTRREGSKKQAGRIVYSIGGENCVGESCFQQSFKESDRCIDKKTLLKMTCGKVEPQETKIPCPQACVGGFCQ